MGLKVYDLQCDSGHVFEGWFQADSNYEAQRAGGLLSCPVCGSQQVERKLSAPRLNLAHAGAPAAAPERAAPAVAAPPDQGALLRQLRQALRQMENVGPRFAEEARRMHEGESDARAIRGTATPEERRALADEGIDCLPIPAFLDDDRLQ